MRSLESIDPRPEQIRDERPGAISYPDNSNPRMLQLLAALPGADVSKVPTQEVATDALELERVQRPRVCFIDGDNPTTPAHGMLRSASRLAGERRRRIPRRVG